MFSCHDQRWVKYAGLFQHIFIQLKSSISHPRNSSRIKLPYVTKAGQIAHWSEHQITSTDDHSFKWFNQTDLNTMWHTNSDILKSKTKELKHIAIICLGLVSLM